MYLQHVILPRLTQNKGPLSGRMYRCHLCHHIKGVNGYMMESMLLFSLGGTWSKLIPKTVSSKLMMAVCV